MSATMGWVVGSWSCMYAHALRLFAKVTHASLKLLASLAPRVPHEVCEGFLEPQVVHHFMVTRSPNHMCAISWQMGVGAAFEVVLGCAGDEDVVFGEGDQAGVLHCADVVFGHECLLVLGGYG